MSTDLATAQAELAKELAALSSRLAPASGNQISTKGKIFTLPNGSASPGPLSVVILDWTAVNFYYSGVYNPAKLTAPSCWALNKNLPDMVPSENSDQVHTDCPTCINNQWGSSPTGGGKACKNQRRLLVAPPNATLDDKEALMTLMVSPTGIKGFEAYVRTLASDYNMLPIRVVTEITFNPNETYPSLVFNYVEAHENLEVLFQLRARGQDMLMREPEKRPQAA